MLRNAPIAGQREATSIGEQPNELRKPAVERDSAEEGGSIASMPGSQIVLPRNGSDVIFVCGENGRPWGIWRRKRGKIHAPSSTLLRPFLRAKLICISKDGGRGGDRLRRFSQTMFNSVDLLEESLGRREGQVGRLQQALGRPEKDSGEGEHGLGAGQSQAARLSRGSRGSTTAISRIGLRSRPLLQVDHNKSSANSIKLKMPFISQRKRYELLLRDARDSIYSTRHAIGDVRGDYSRLLAHSKKKKMEAVVRELHR